MDINIEQKPPATIPQVRWKYTRVSLFFLALVVCSVIIGVTGVLLNTGYDDILQNAAFVLFVASGFAFVYFTEKLLGDRKPTPKQEEKLIGLAPGGGAGEIYRGCGI